MKSLKGHIIVQPHITHRDWDKITTSLQMTFFNSFILMNESCILIQISLEYVFKGPIDNKAPSL